MKDCNDVGTHTRYSLCVMAAICSQARLSVLSVCSCDTVEEAQHKTAYPPEHLRHCGRTVIIVYSSYIIHINLLILARARVYHVSGLCLLRKRQNDDLVWCVQGMYWYVCLVNEAVFVVCIGNRLFSFRSFLGGYRGCLYKNSKHDCLKTPENIKSE